MRLYLPINAPHDPSVPRWWLLSLEFHRRQGFRLIIRLGWCAIDLAYKSPVPNPGVLFTRKTVYTQEFIVHPNGGNAAHLVCKECGAAYPLTRNPVPCGFCAVEKESGLRLWWTRTEWVEGANMFKNKWEGIRTS